MAWNKACKKTNWGKKDAPKSYKEKRGKLSPLMTEKDKQKAGIHDLSYDFACRITRLYQWGMEGSREFGNQGVDTLNPSIPKSLLSQIFRSGTSIGANLKAAIERA